jgi:hypothetical protein
MLRCCLVLSGSSRHHLTNETDSQNAGALGGGHTDPPGARTGSSQRRVPTPSAVVEKTESTGRTFGLIEDVSERPSRRCWAGT